MFYLIVRIVLQSIEVSPTFDLFAPPPDLLGCQDKRRGSSPGQVLHVRRSRPHPLAGGLRSSSPETSDLTQTEEEGEQGGDELRPEHLQRLAGGGLLVVYIISLDTTNWFEVKQQHHHHSTSAQSNFIEMTGEIDN